VTFEFRWNDWNLNHIAVHGVGNYEAEFVVKRARRPWPECIGDDKWRVWGPTLSGRLLQVIYVVDPDDTVYVIHTRDLGDVDKRRYRRRRQ